MNVISIIMAAFAVLAAIDRIFGSRLGLGKEFDRGFNLLGAMALTMGGMLVVAPYLGELMKPFSLWFYQLTRIDPSVIPASLFANDMGGEPLASQLAVDAALGKFNGLIVSSMMGVIISFNIPYALGVVKKERHRELFLGILCGIATVPVGCFVSGLMLGLSPLLVLFDLLPIIFFAILVSVGLALAPDLCVKIFKILGVAINVLITIGLGLGILKFLTGVEIVKGLAPIEGDPLMICCSAAIVMSGAFPLVYVVSKLLNKPLEKLGGLLGINSTAAVGFMASLATNTTTFEMMNRMDKKGAMLNAAFAMAGAFTFAAHLAYTMAVDPSYLLPMIVGKLVAGACSVAVAAIIYKRTEMKGTEENER